MDNNIVKFTAIIICLAIAVSSKQHVLGRRDHILLCLAMFGTVAADFFLVVLFVYPPGLLFFCAVQTLYAARFGGGKALRAAPAVVILPIMYFAWTGDLLITLALAYAQMFLLSYGCMVRAFVRKKYPGPNNWLILSGMTLFVMCDVSVAIWNLWRMGVIESETAGRLAESAIWLFYAPSQVCLALSARRFTKRA